MKSQIDVSVGRTAIDEAKSKIKSIRDIIPTPRVLTPTEIRTIPKVGPKGHMFVRRAKDYAMNPAYTLSLVDPEQFENDVNIYDGYIELEKELELLHTDIKSMTILAGSEAYSNALAIYKNLQRLAEEDVPGAKGAFEELRAIYPGRRGPSAEPKK